MRIRFRGLEVPDAANAVQQKNPGCLFGGLLPQVGRYEMRGKISCTDTARTGCAVAIKHEERFRGAVDMGKALPKRMYMEPTHGAAIAIQEPKFSQDKATGTKANQRYSGIGSINEECAHAGRKLPPAIKQTADDDQTIECVPV